MAIPRKTNPNRRIEAIRRIAEESQAYEFLDGMVLGILPDGITAMVRISGSSTTIPARILTSATPGRPCVLLRKKNSRVLLVLGTFEPMSTMPSPVTGDPATGSATLSPPQGLTTIGLPESILLFWSPVAQRGDLAYYVQVAEVGNEDNPLVTYLVSGTVFLYGAAGGTTRTFRVSALSLEGKQSAWSAWATDTSGTATGDQSYTPANGADWNDPDPTTIPEALEQLVDRILVLEGAGPTDHGSLNGLGDDDHPQYVLADGSREWDEITTPSTPTTDKWKLYAKSDGFYYLDDTGSEVGPLGISGVTDHGLLSGLGDDDHAQYLLASGLREWDTQAGTPANPSVSKWKLYAKSDGFYYLDSAGNEVGPLGSGGGGVTDHGALSGLGDDDHTQYLLANGGRIADYLQIHSTGSGIGNLYIQTNTNVADDTANIYLIRTRGTLNVPTVVSSGDYLGRLRIGTGFSDDQVSVDLVARALGTQGSLAYAPEAIIYLRTRDTSTQTLVERLTLTTDGNLGIGTAPGERLAVNGAIQIKGIAEPGDPAASVAVLWQDDQTDGNVYLKTAGSAYRRTFTQLNVPPPLVVQGRLTLASGVPVSRVDQTNKQTLYFTPYNGNLIWIYNSTRGLWTPINFTEASLSFAPASGGVNYDVFGYDDSGDLGLDIAAWLNNTTRDYGLVLQDGVLVMDGNSDYRYLGTVRTPAAGYLEDSLTKRFVYNHYNQVPLPLLRSQNNINWTATGTQGTYTVANADNDNSVHIVNGYRTTIELTLDVIAQSSQTTGVTAAIGYSSTQPYSVYTGGRLVFSGAEWNSAAAHMFWQPSEGLSSYYWLNERNDYITWYAVNSGLSGVVYM